MYLKYWLGFFAGFLGIAYLFDSRRRSLRRSFGPHVSTEAMTASNTPQLSLGRIIPFRTEEQLLFDEIEELDRENPDWYRPNLIAGAKRLLAEGNSFRKVAAVYGAKITKEAEQQLRAA